MVSTMDIVSPTSETCDNRRAIISNSNVVDFPIIAPPPLNCDQLTKKILKLDLTQREKGSIDEDEKSCTSKLKSPKSPLSNISEYMRIRFKKNFFASFLLNSNFRRVNKKCKLQIFS